jgi:hypothetical protein
MVYRRVVTSLLQIKIRLRGVGDTGTNAEEVILGAPEIVEIDIRVSILVKHSRKVSFALEAPVKLRRCYCCEAELDETKHVGSCQLNPEPY